MTPANPETHERVPELISIIMPVFNAERFVSQAIVSCLRQTNPHFEILAVDDCSSDRSAEVLSSFNDERLRVFRHTSNQGAGVARNTALAHSRGEWITVLDADDCYAEWRLEVLVDLAKRDGGAAVYTDNWYNWQLATEPPPMPFPSSAALANVREWSLVDWLAYSREARPFYHHSLLRAMGDRYPDLRAGQDTVFTTRLLVQNSTSLRMIDVDGYIYRNTPGSITTPSLQHSQRWLESARMVHAIVPQEAKVIAKQRVRMMERDVELKRVKEAAREEGLLHGLIRAGRTPRTLLTAITRVRPWLRSRRRKLRLRSFQQLQIDRVSK